MHVRLRRARIATLATLGMVVMSSVALPGIGVFREPDPVRAALGAVGTLLFAAAQAALLYATVTPDISRNVQHRLAQAFCVAALASVPLVGPLAASPEAGRWESWAWIGASILATAPVLGRRALVLSTVAATLAAGALLAWWHGDIGYFTITVAVGLCFIAVNGLHLWLWTLLVEADEGRQAQVRLAAAEERLRFARDVHDLLGHDLSVIALKAELAERDPGRAAQEAADLRRLAAAALSDLRRAVHGYREVDLRAQLAAIEKVLRSSGVRCTATLPAEDLPQEIAALLAPVVREAGTNVLRHSRATWCTIDVTREGVTVANDGAVERPADPHSSGLRGLADRLAESGGTLRTRLEGGVFTLEATLR
ncbi:sensor histidine kinase [Nonomuraea sp. NPDC050790]|uniref:sensor histidine kinase n=1 Tax=Nonomuraea sp. NPDC050790 TaxID=3364371 RepID=UPI003791D7F1